MAVSWRGRIGPSSMIEELARFEAPKSLSETAQRQPVASVERQWWCQQPTIEGEKVLLAGYETHILDTGLENESR